VTVQVCIMEDIYSVQCMCRR